MAESMVTTVDNPFDPFTQWDEWDAYDRAQGYHTSAFLARLVKSSYELSEADQSAALEEAAQEIARENVSGKHRLVTRDGPALPSPPPAPALDRL